MKRHYLLFYLLFASVLTMQGQQPGTKPLRIADSLTAKERAERDPVLLKSELDSLVKLYAPPRQEVAKDTTASKENNIPAYFSGGMLVLLLVSISTLLLFYRQRRLLAQLVAEKKLQNGLSATLSSNGIRKNGKKSPIVQSPEEKIETLHAELNKLLKENEGLQGVVKEYNGIQHEYDSLRHSLHRAYKVKNYPGYDTSKKESQSIKTVLETEKALADYAYGKFLKPLLAIADANKNDPARMSTADKEKLFDMILSLSFLYIEYLYLRVSELAVGGTIVERLMAMTGGTMVREELLKKLNRESGSRALVMRMALDKAAVNNLSYPVFDETNLNNG